MIIGLMAGRDFGSDISHHRVHPILRGSEIAQDPINLISRLREKPGWIQKRARPWAETAGGSVEKVFKRSSKELE